MLATQDGPGQGSGRLIKCPAVHGHVTHLNTPRPSFHNPSMYLPAVGAGSSAVQVHVKLDEVFRRRRQHGQQLDHVDGPRVVQPPPVGLLYPADPGVWSAGGRSDGHRDVAHGLHTAGTVSGRRCGIPRQCYQTDKRF